MSEPYYADDQAPTSGDGRRKQMNENRVEALRQAVVARQEDDTPDSLVARAEAFYGFLNVDRPRPKVVAG